MNFSGPVVRSITLAFEHAVSGHWKFMVCACSGREKTNHRVPLTHVQPQLQQILVAFENYISIVGSISTRTVRLNT